MADEEITRVGIPGELIARYRDGAIEAITFLPSGSDAGHFGPAAVVIEGPDLEVESTEGPFWRAVQRFLATGHTLGWEE